MKNTIYSIVFLSLLLGINHSNKPIFESERIDFYIDRTKCIVKANYYFRNAGEIDIIDQILFYPFPINENTPFPDSIMVLNPKNQEIDYSQISNGIYFKVSKKWTP